MPDLLARTTTSRLNLAILQHEQSRGSQASSGVVPGIGHSALGPASLQSSATASGGWMTGTGRLAKRRIRLMNFLSLVTNAVA